MNIKKARENAGLSQKQVALELKVSAPTVSDWEAGKIFPSAKNLISLANVLHTSVDYLLGTTDVPSDDWSGEHLCDIRHQFGEKPEDVAALIGVPSSLYSQYEEGTAAPSISALCALAKHFCCEADYLLGLSGALYDDEDKVITHPFWLSDEEKQTVELLRLVEADDMEVINAVLKKYHKASPDAECEPPREAKVV